MNEIVKFTSSRWPFKALAASAGEIDVGPSEKSSYVQDVNVDIPIGSNCMVYTHTYIYIFVLVFFLYTHLHMVDFCAKCRYMLNLTPLKINCWDLNII